MKRRMLVDGRTVWRWFEEFDTSHSPDGLPEDYFVTVVEAFLATGQRPARPHRRRPIAPRQRARNRPVRSRMDRDLLQTSRLIGLFFQKNQ